MKQQKPHLNAIVQRTVILDFQRLYLKLRNTEQIYNNKIEIPNLLRINW